MLLRLTLHRNDENIFPPLIQIILANFVLLIHFFKTDVYTGNRMKMLDTNKQSTYFIINEAKHPHFGNSVI